MTLERYQLHFVHLGFQTPSTRSDSLFHEQPRRFIFSEPVEARLRRQKRNAKFKQAMHPNNPAAAEKRLQRETIAAARAERAAQREAARQEHEREVARQAALTAEIAAERARADAERAAREEAERLEREAALKAEEKAARDIRYAARKAAKKERRRGY